MLTYRQVVLEMTTWTMLRLFMAWLQLLALTLILALVVLALVRTIAGYSQLELLSRYSYDRLSYYCCPAQPDSMFA